VSIFTQKVRLFIGSIPCNPFYIFRLSVHLTLYICRIVLANPKTFIMDRSCTINAFYCRHSGPEVRSSSSVFISQRPDYYGRMIFKILNISYVPVYYGSFHFRFLIEPAHIAVALNICLSNQEDAIFIAQLIPARIVGVVGSANKVAVALFDKLKVAYHLCLCYRVSNVGPVFVTVYTFKFNRGTIH
jgi:hypothetical protein